MSQTKIEWATHSWNPITGCDSVSIGCENCYAEKMAKRLKGRFGYPADEPFKVTYHPDKLTEPFKWKNPAIIFVCSMGDLFHKDVKKEHIDDILQVINANPQHNFLILTKRPKNIEDKLYGVDQNHPMRFFRNGDSLENIWLEVTCENQDLAHKRIPILLKIPAKIHFVSYEPLLGPIYHVDKNIDWVIVGGETSNSISKARPIYLDWVLYIQRLCKQTNTQFFFKQWGTHTPTGQTPGKIYGVRYHEYPKL